jgi:hypothetical protein
LQGLAELPADHHLFGLAPITSTRLSRAHEAMRSSGSSTRVESFLTELGVPHEFAGVVGEPIEEIVDVAERRDADVIVVGTREPRFLERLLGGSVSQGVARRAHCDVLIVHPPAAASGDREAGVSRPGRSKEVPR